MWRAAAAVMTLGADGWPVTGRTTEHCPTIFFVDPLYSRMAEDLHLGGMSQRTQAGTEFVRGFVQHTLPRGFQKIRCYGWMCPNSRIGLDEVNWLVWLFLGWMYWLASGHVPQPSSAEHGIVRCAQCGGRMRSVGISYEPSGALPEHAIEYLDSG